MVFQACPTPPCWTVCSLHPCASSAGASALKNARICVEAASERPQKGPGWSGCRLWGVAGWIRGVAAGVAAKVELGRLRLLEVDGQFAGEGRPQRQFFSVVAAHLIMTDSDVM